MPRLSQHDLDQTQLFPYQILVANFLLEADYGNVQLDDLEVVGMGDLQGGLQDVEELAQVPVKSGSVDG